MTDLHKQSENFTMLRASLTKQTLCSAQTLAVHMVTALGLNIWGWAFDVLREFLYKHSHSACSRNGCHSHSALLFRGSVCYKVKRAVWDFRKEEKRHKKIDLDHTCFLRRSDILVAHEEGTLKCYRHAELGTLHRVPFLYGFKTNKNRNVVNLGRYRQQAESERGDTPGQI